MAQMYPEWISDEQRSADPRFRAEYKVYDILSQRLPQNWVVFYNRIWTWVESRSRIRTREADFIIAHPTHGMILMEVKGGRIDVKDGKWVSTDRDGVTYDINPFEQVANAATALERKLRDEHAGLFRDYRFATCVCFPDVNMPPSDTPGFGVDLQRVTLDADCLRDPLKTIMNILDASKGCASPGMNRITILRELVASSWYIHAPKSIQVYDTEKEIKQLTEDQFKLLYQIVPACRKLLVTGCAGSGKTMLAAEVARRLSFLEGKRVLFTCYNRNLANWLGTRSFFNDNPRALVANFHRLCAEFARAGGLTLPDVIRSDPAESDPVFSTVYPDLLVDVAVKVGEQFDALIVDEGQDFLDSWWLPLQLLLKENGVFHVYYDSRQRLKAGPQDLPADVKKDATFLELTENVRNTRPIHNLAMKFHLSHGAGYKSLSRGGTEPEFIPVPSGSREPQVVREVVERLITEGIPPCDIAILTPLSLRTGKSLWKPDETMVGRYRLVHHLNPGPHEIFCSSVRSAKGLEFPVVILTELHSPVIRDEVKDLAAHLYVGISRARSHLIVISEPSAFARLCPH